MPVRAADAAGVPAAASRRGGTRRLAARLVPGGPGRLSPGHMDEYDAEFKRAWAADHKMTGERLDWPKGAWPYEGGGYWFDGLVRLGYALHDDGADPAGERRLDVVASHMNPNSILFLWWLNQNNPDDGKAISSWGYGRCGLADSWGAPWRPYYAGPETNACCRRWRQAYSGDPDWLRSGGSPTPGRRLRPTPGPETSRSPRRSTRCSQRTAGQEPGETAWTGTGTAACPTSPRMEPRPRITVVAFIEGHNSAGRWAISGPASGVPRRRARLARPGRARTPCSRTGVTVADEHYGPTGAFRGTETCDVAGYLWSQIVSADDQRRGPHGGPGGTGLLQCRPGHGRARLQDARLFPEPNRIAARSAPAHGPRASRLLVQADASSRCAARPR